MPVNRSTAPIIVLVWLGVNTILGLIIASFRGVMSGPNPAEALFVSVMITHIIGGSGALSGYVSGILLAGPSGRKLALMLLTSMIGTLLGTLGAGWLAYVLGHWPNGAVDFWKEYSLPSALLAVLLSSTAAYIHRMYWFGDPALQAPDNEDEQTSSVRPEVLPFFSEGRHYFLPFSEIIHVSARREGTEVFTTRTSLYGSVPLRRIQEKLPPSRFVQIHRSHVISLDYISHLEYDAGGNYLIHLRDEEDSVLPVSRSRVQTLKTRLGMNEGSPSEIGD